MKNRIFRFLVCLVLVCVILVNCSPIRAQATGVEALYLSTVFVNPTIAVTAVLFGLGVMVTAAATAVFTKLVDDITVDMVDKGLISSSGVDMYRSDADGAATYLVNQELVEAVRDYLWDNEVLTLDGMVPEGWLSYGGYVFPSIESLIYVKFPYKALCLDYSGNYIFIQSSAEFERYFYNNGYRSIGKLGGSTGTEIAHTYEDDTWVHEANCTVSSGTMGHWFETVIWTNFDLYDRDSGELLCVGGVIDDFSTACIGVSDGFAAGQIAPQGKTFEEGYSEWASGARSLPTLRDGKKTDAESAYIALGMGMTQEETMAMTQAAVQSGVGTYENTGTATDAVTATGLKGWLDTIRLTLVSGFSDVVDGLLSGISSLFVPSAEAMAAQQDKWTTLLSDRFGAVYDSVALIDNIASAFSLGATQTQIRFPLITIPFGDVNWEFGGWMVDVVPDGFQVLVDALKVGIDILCTLAFVNAMKLRFDRVLGDRG